MGAGCARGTTNSMDLDDAPGDSALPAKAEADLRRTEPLPDDAVAERLSDMRDDAADPTMRLTRMVAKARIANVLFASDRRVDIGRYHLLERAGHGGMGVVWSAWDPELERRVAIKLVRATVKSARDQMQREGQALAKLSHPNVVPVFDVGVIDDQVYLVMEWVRGPTLRELCRGEHSPREIMQVYLQVCAGLGAAHRAGVVHRDFKPENAICGEDGRVRLLDFGLAVQEATASSTAGTPRYMAPEQTSGGVVNAAADQYAFCVALREALFGNGTRSIPRWLAAILDRGSAVNPAARFPTMDALGAALRRDNMRRWRRRSAAFVAVAGAAVAFAVGRARSKEPAAARCGDAASHISAIWSPSARQIVAAHMRSLGEFGAHEVEPLLVEFAGYGTALATARTSACVDYNRGELPPILYEHRLRCLSRADASFSAAVEVVASVSADHLSDALIAVRSLPSPAGCATQDLVAVAPPPQALAAKVSAIGAEVERARVLALAASPNAVEVAHAASDAAQATGYTPLFARAAMVQGWALATVEPHSAKQLLDRAFHAALKVGDDVLAVEAYARARFVASSDGELQPADREQTLVEDLAIRIADPGRFARALLYNNLGTGRIVANDLAGARAWLGQALATWHPPLGDRAHDIELGAVLQNLALVEEDPARRVELSQRAVDSRQSQLGPDHPATISARIQLAWFTPDPAASARAFAQTCGAIAAWHPQLRAECSYDQGWLAITRGDRSVAVTAMTTARTSDDPPQAQIAAAYLDTVSADRARIAAAQKAMRNLARELAVQADWWNHRDAADAWVIVALGNSALGNASASTRAWQDAVAELRDLPVLQRRRAWIHATLARQLAATQSKQSRHHAEAAIAGYRNTGGYEAEIAELQRLLKIQRTE